jgi:hypothetical protein
MVVFVSQHISNFDLLQHIQQHQRAKCEGKKQLKLCKYSLKKNIDIVHVLQSLTNLTLDDNHMREFVLPPTFRKENDVHTSVITCPKSHPTNDKPSFQLNLS